MPMPAPRAAILFLTFFPRRFLLPCLLSPSGVPRAPEAGDIFPTAGCWFSMRDSRIDSYH